MTSIYHLRKAGIVGHHAVETDDKAPACKHCPRTGGNSGMKLYECTCGLFKGACNDCMYGHLVNAKAGDSTPPPPAPNASKVAVLLLACQHWQVAFNREVGRPTPEKFYCETCKEVRTIVYEGQAMAKPYESERPSDNLLVEAKDGKIEKITVVPYPK